MVRTYVVGGVSLALLLVVGQPLFAQEWPVYNGDPLDRGPGGYLAWYKILLLWLPFAFWVKTSDWVNRDTHEVGDSTGMTPEIWNPIIVFSFLVGFIFAITMPLFLAGLPVMLLTYLVPLTWYILQRNSRVTDDQKVLTPTHIKGWIGGLGKGRKRRNEPKAPHEQGPPVELNPAGAESEQADQANLIMARQSPGYTGVKELVADALDRRTERIMLDYTKEVVSCRYEIDGMWHNIEPRDRETGDVMLAVMKKLANLNMTERRARQEGYFSTRYREKKYTCELTSQGTKTGERVILQFSGKKATFETLEDMGMRESQRDRVKELLGEHEGLIVLSAAPSNGLSSLWQMGMKASDRYLRDFVSIEDEGKLMPYVENIDIVKYNPATEGPDAKMRDVLLKQPDVICIPNIPNARTLELISELAVNADPKLTVTSLAAKDAVEAALRLIALKAPVEPLARALRLIVNQRLIRKLCETCKQAYEPSPQLLQKLGIPAGRVRMLFREYQPPPAGQETKDEPEVCPDCSGIGYRGRTGVFEVLEITNEFRAAMDQTPKLEVLRQVAKQGGHRGLQEEGILLVARGITSLSELQRVLKK